MIIDELASAGRYACLNENFARAVRFLKETDLDSLPFGTFAVDGENVYAMMQEYETRAGEPKFESHDRYADIQLVLEGRERFAFGWDPSMGPLEAGKDLRFGTVNGTVDFVLEKDRFAIFLPGEAHAPGLADKVPARCRKLVVKVLCRP